MRLVVTGALGHIGSRLIRELGENYPQAEIVMIDNMLTQRYPSLFHLPTSGKYQFLEAGIQDLNLIEILKDADIVYHLAAITDAQGTVDKGEWLEENNLNSTRLIAEACLSTHTPLFFVSTTSVYGTQKNLVDEECSEEELKPQSPYASCKLKEEKLIQDYCRQDGLQAVLCRFGTIFGTSMGMRFHTAVNKFCWQAVLGQPLTVWETALHQKRPYLDLRDAVEVCIFFLEKQIFDGRIYNVVTCNHTVADIIDAIKKYMPALEVKKVQHKIMNQLSYEVACFRLKSHGFIFQGSLDQAIGDTINLLRNCESLQWEVKTA